MHSSSLNHCYRLVFNESLGAWVAVPETAKGKGKAKTRSGAVAAAVAATVWLAGLGATPSHAGGPPLPTDGKVVAGSGTIAQSGTRLTVNQTSARMAAEWQTFSIDKGHAVEFVQPSASAVALNRVLGPDASVIQGQISANGQVFLVNPNGVLFTPTAQVNVGGLVASTLDISNADFMAGRYRFDGESTADVTNQGSLQAARGGYVAMIAGRIVNEGTISAPGGAALLGAGQTVTLDLGGPVQLQVERGALNAQIANGGVIEAGGGRILLTAKAASELGSAVINQTGHLEATSLAANERGEIVLRADGGAVIQTGNVQANGVAGGRIEVRADALVDAGQWEARGSSQAGGAIDVAVTRHLEQTANATMDASGATAGGTVRATSDGSAWLSGSLAANAAAGTGGDVAVTAADLTVAGARLQADGTTGGGRVRVGGGWQGGDADLANAGRTAVSAASTLSASATEQGNGGTVVAWSEQGTGVGGQVSARGGRSGGDGGAVELSSRGRLAMGAEVDVTAPAGRAGSVLLDPKNIVIDGSTPPSYNVTPLLDPTPAAGDLHGSGTPVQLAGGNLVVASPADDAVAANAGAVRLYRPDGTLLATLTGSQAGDQVGNGTITALPNGNYVVRSPNWMNGTAANAGAATWGSGTTGVSGAVSAANSLVGTVTNDFVASSLIAVLANGNYLVTSSSWDNGAITDAGAVTWGSAATGVTGAVSVANSLVGGSASDNIGNTGIRLLANGNYLVQSQSWHSGGLVNVGAVTWGSGTTGVIGVVSAANSLVGSTASDNVGASISLLANGNYVVNSTSWDNGPAINAGAVTWGSAATGVKGVISAANSLVGSSSNDVVGGGGITRLANGNYLVTSTNWSNGAAVNAGAVTWGSGTAGVSGAVGAANSLVGTRFDDRVGDAGIIELTNGNYVVRNWSWDNGAVVDAGAATWGSGTTGVKGAVSAANSLVGSTANDQVSRGAVVPLANGNYVVTSAFWNNGAVAGAGAVTWGNGATGVTGVVSAANSLVGSKANDLLGIGGITTLTNGNYVVSSPNWDNGAVVDAGAVTWRSGTAATSGVLSAANSLVGTSASDAVGNDGVMTLSNGNYVVRSASWNNGAIARAGAVTWGSGTTGVSGAVSAANSLVGSTAFDQVGNGGVWALTNGNYVVRSSVWDNGAAANAGAVTWGNGATGVTGAVTAANSLVGSTSNDQVGSHGIVLLTNDNYLVRSSLWNNGAAASAGAVTWGSGTAGVTGVVSAANSLVGSTANDQVGSGGILVLSNGNYVVRSQNWSNGAATGAGAVTWGSGTSGVSGVLGAANSLVGSTLNDQVGNNGVLQLTNGNYIVVSTQWDNGAVVNAGAVTWGSGTAGVNGVVGAANSLVGSSAGDGVGGTGTVQLANGDYVVRSAAWDNGALLNVGAVTLGSGTAGVSGAVSTANSFTGTAANDLVGSGAVLALADGRALVSSPQAGGTAGRVDIIGRGAPPFAATYAADAGGNSTLGVSQLTALLDTGASVTLQANNDITLSAALNVNNATGNGGALTLQAGRSILLDAGVSTDNGNLTLIANDRAASGVVDAHRDPGAAAITMADGTSIAAGTGAVNIQLRDGAGNTNNAAGAVTLATVQAGSLALDSVGLGRTITAANKTYDGNTTATVTGDTVTGLAFTASSNLSAVAATASFADKNADAGKTVTANALQVTGFNGAATANATNAGADVRPTTTADIAKRTLTVSATGQDKVYDGTVAATASYGDDRVGGDAVTVTGTATFADKNAGAGKAVGVTGIGIAGADAGNYALAATTAATTANITQRALTVTATGQSKVYDSTTAATVSYGDNRVAGDVLTAAGTATFGDKNVGTGKAVGVSGIGLSGTDAGNYALAATTAATTANITQRGLTVTATGQDKVYDGTTAATVAYGDNRIGGDAVTVTGSATFGDKNVGTGKAVGVTGIGIAGADAGNYALAATTAATTANITQRALTVTATGQNKVYDGTTAATVSYGDNRVAGDVLTAAGTATFGDKNVGTGKAVGVSGIGIGGTDAGNYSLAATTAAATANITQRALTVTATGQNKVYDGTIAATVNYGDNRAGGDAVTVTGTATFANKNAGTGKAVGVTGIGIAGADAGNYALTATTATSAADITQRTLTVTATGQNKVYDGSTAATVSYSDNRVGGDTVNVTGTAAFSDKSVGTGKAVGVTGIGIAGADAGNYALAGTTATTAADITPRALTVIATGQNKVYDGTTAATVAYGDNRVAGDVVAVTGTATFGDKNAGAGKSVGVTGIGIAGADAGNYSLAATTASTTANITQRALTVTAAGQNKVYDGTTAATATYGDNRIGGDAITVTGTATFADKNAGAGKAIGVTGIGIAGADAGNYSLAATNAATTANITQRALSITATGQDKVYDGTTAATASYADNRVAGDALALTGTAAFADRNAGTGKAVTVTGLAAGGADAGNYVLSATSTGTTANITPRPLDVTGSKAFDGSEVFLGSALAQGNVISGDTVTLSGQAAVASSNAGSYTSFTSNGLASSNANYTITGGAVNVTITAAPPTVPVPPTTPVPPPAAGASLSEVIAATLFQGERDQATEQSAEALPPPQQQQSVLQAPRLHLEVVQGGIRMPAEAAQRQEK